MSSFRPTPKSKVVATGKPRQKPPPISLQNSYADTMKSLSCCWLLAFLACCAPGVAQGILIPVSFYPVQDAPFTLTVETRWERSNGQGPKQSTQRILRDSAGRQRYEAPIVDGVPISSTVTLYDVVAGKSIKLDMDAKTAEVAPMRVGPTVVLDVTVASSLPPATAADGQTFLGTMQVAGFEAWGQRTVKTITRADGSSFIQDRELWLSTHYGMPVMQVMRRPQGKTTQIIANFSAAEPDPALFLIPPGFAVTNAPPPPEPAPGTVRIGGNVSAPVVLRSAEPEFSEQARRKKVSGQVMVHFIVDEQGIPQDVKVVHGLGMGLDENAVAAVKQYRFKPAMRDGVPVKVEMNIIVNFQIFGKP
jgi:TonB family protein